MQRSSAVDGFSLAYERHGSGAPVVLLHGWPGDHEDWREVVTRLEGRAGVVQPGGNSGSCSGQSTAVGAFAETIREAL